MKWWAGLLVLLLVIAVGMFTKHLYMRREPFRGGGGQAISRGTAGGDPLSGAPIGESFRGGQAISRSGGTEGDNDFFIGGGSGGGGGHGGGSGHGWEHDGVRGSGWRTIGGDVGGGGWYGYGYPFFWWGVDYPEYAYVCNTDADCTVGSCGEAGFCVV